MLSRHRYPVILLALVVQLALGSTTVAASAATSNPSADYIVVFRSSANANAETSGLEQRFGFLSKYRYNFALKGFAARLTATQASLISRLPFVEQVHPDGPVEAIGTTGLVAGDAIPPGIQRIGGATASVVHTAADVAVAVIDTGIDLNHPDLNAVNGTNCQNSGAPAQDDNGHGTHVAGTIGARNSGFGVVGVAPGTTLIAVKVLDADGSGSWSGVICGIDWVGANSASRGIKVANMSLGGGSTSIMRTAIRNATNAGVTFVVAAGNNGRNLANYSPSNYTEVLAVTAVADTDGRGGALGSAPTCRSGEADDRYASFSNYATSSTHINHTIAAPGVCVRSTIPGGGYSSNYSGTSMASPHVAGAVALCVSAGGACAGLTPPNVIGKMRTLAQQHAQAAPGDWFTGDPTRPVGSRYYGYMTWIGQDLAAATPDFSLSSSPTSRTVTKGTDATYTVTVTPSGGFNSSVALSVISGLPSGAIASFNPSSTTGSSTLTVNTANSATGGPFTLTIQGQGGGLTRTTTVSLTVNAPPVPDFTLSSPTGSQTVTKGTNAVYTVNINRTNGHSASVDLSVTSGLPSGASASFSPDPTTGGSSTLTINTTNSATGGPVTLTIQGTDGSLNRTTTVSLTVNAPPVPDFTLSSPTGSQTVTKGTNAVYTVNINRTNGHSASVDLSVTSGLPSGASASFSPDPTTGGSSTLTINTTNSATGGPVTLTIQGTDGSLNRTTTVTLTVNPVVAGDFSVSASPSSRSINRGSSTTYTVTLNRTGGFSDSVAFSVTGLPTGATASFTPSSTTGTSSTLTVQTTSSTPAGTSTLTIRGTAGALVRTTTVSLTVNVPWWCWFGGC